MQKRQWIAVILLLVFVNTGIRFVFKSGFVNSNELTLDDERKQSKYVEMTQKTSLRWWDKSLQIAAYIKIGDIEKAFKEIQIVELAGQPFWLEDIARALLLREKWDVLGAEKLLSHTTSQDPLLRSLFLSIRAHFLCEQWKRNDCAVLAKDAEMLDSFAAYPLLLQARVERVYRDYQQANILLGRAEKAWIADNERIQFNRGMIAYYMRDREIVKSNLQALVMHDEYWYDAKIFLGRDHFEHNEYDVAEIYFLEAKKEKWNTTWVHDLRLWRVYMAKKEYTKALAAYKVWYDNFPTAIELTTDMLIPAKKLWNQSLFDSLVISMRQSVRKSVWSYEIAARRLRETKEYALAAEFINDWSQYASWADEMQALRMQQFNVYMSKFFDLISENTSDIETIDELFMAMDAMNIAPEQLYFVRWLASLLRGDSLPALESFALVPSIKSPQEQLFIYFRYKVLAGKYADAENALQIASSMYGDTITAKKVMRMKRVFAAKTWDKTSAEKYQKELSIAWYIRQEVQKENMTEQELYNESMVLFRPRIGRMTQFMWSDI